MESTNRTATVNLDSPHGFEVRHRFEFYDEATGLPVSMEGKTVELEIYENSMASVFSTDSGVGGAISISANAVEVVITGIYEDYFDVIKEYPQKQYRYRLDIDNDYRLQGAWRSLIRAGKVDEHGDLWRVVVNQSIVHVGVASVASSERPASRVRIVTESGPITLLDDTVIIRAGLASVTLILPTPAEAWGEGFSVPLVLVRDSADFGSGVVTITGTGPELPEVLYAGESLWLQSDGANWHVIG